MTEPSENFTSEIARLPHRVLRVAYLTDWHIHPDAIAEAGVRAAWEQVYSLPDRPDLIINGGDAILSGVSAPLIRVVAQWQAWERVSEPFSEICVRHCVGNHDIWGWNRKKSGCTGEEPLYGKAMALDRYHLEQAYYSFAEAGWHFIVLDSLLPGGTDGYTARLDELQLEWLSTELASLPDTTPVVLVSHIPLLAGGALFFTGTLSEVDPVNEWTVPTTWLHADARRINTLLNRHPNVKLCLSGHLHLFDRAEYNGVTYLCGGAVSGRWWRGDYHQTPPGFVLLDLFANGSFEANYVPIEKSAREI